MAPPTSKIKIRDIEPAALAREVEDDVLNHLQRLAFELEPGILVTVKDSREGSFTHIGLSVLSLAAYARGTSGLDSDVHEYMVTLLEVLSPPVGGAISATGLDAAIQGDVDVDDLLQNTRDRLALVTCAALGREAIELGQDVRPNWLAAFAGVTTAQVRLLARNGKLSRNKDTEITNKSARQWLALRAAAADDE